MAKSPEGFGAPKDRLLCPIFGGVATSGGPLPRGRGEIPDFPVPVSFLRIQAFPKVCWPCRGWSAHSQRAMASLECYCDCSLGLVLSSQHPLPAKSPPLSTLLTPGFCSEPLSDSALGVFHHLPQNFSSPKHFAEPASQPRGSDVLKHRGLWGF